jgi:hypothetical protein
MKSVIRPNFAGVFFVSVLTFFGVSMAYSVIVQELSSYLTTVVFFFMSVACLIRVLQEHKKNTE